MLFLSNVNTKERARHVRGGPPRRSSLSAPGLRSFGDPHDLTDVQRVVMGDMHQDSRERARPAGGECRVHHARRCQRTQHALHRRPRGVVHGKHIVPGALAAGPELGLAVSNVRSAADRVPEIELVRPSQMQHEIADGVGLRVGTPPQVVLVYRVETGANLPGKLVEHAVPDHLQKLSIEGCVVHRAQ